MLKLPEGMYFDVSFHGHVGMIIPVMGAGLGSVGKAQGGLVMLQKLGQIMARLVDLVIRDGSKMVGMGDVPKFRIPKIP